MVKSSIETTQEYINQCPAGNKTKEALCIAYEALQAKGYEPIQQLIGYLISGDPAYITSFNEARDNIRRVGRDELMEEIVRSYFQRNF